MNTRLTNTQLLLTFALSLCVASAQTPATPAPATAATPTAATPATPALPTLTQTPLLPKKGEKVTLSLVLPQGVTEAPTLELSGDAGFRQSVRAAGVNAGTARYEFSLAKEGSYTLKVAGQPVQRIKVGEAKDRLSSPILHLNFDGVRPLADLSGFGNDGKAIGKVSFPQGKVGKGLAFANEESYVEFARSAVLETPTQNMTMSIWLKPTGEERGYSDFFTKGDWNVIKTNNKDGSIDFFTGGWRRGEVNAAQPENWAGQWHHVVGVVEGNEARMYLDGKLVKDGEVEGELKVSPYPWNLGRNAEEPKGRGFKGVLDDVRIYPYALSSSEVEQLYRQSQK